MNFTTHTVTVGINTPTAGPGAEKNKGNGSNPNDPSTSTAGLTHTTSVFTGPTTKNGSEKVGNERVMNEVPSSYANKHNPTSSSKANLRIFEANVSNDADYDVWLLLASVYEFSSVEGVDSVLCDGPWMIHEILIFLNNWSPSVSLLKEELSRVPLWVKFHDIPLVAYTSNGLSLIATKIGIPTMLDSYTNSMYLES
ncbi:primary amine oxidase-like protein [Tanacetum coccineum]